MAGALGRYFRQNPVHLLSLDEFDWLILLAAGETASEAESAAARKNQPD